MVCINIYEDILCMIAKLIHKNDYYYCSECRMKQKLQPYCDFCEAIFSNYEELLLENYKESEYDDVHR